MISSRSNFRAFARTLSMFLLFTLLLSAVSTPRPAQAAAPQDVLKIGLIPDTGGINDQSFNEMAYAGLTRAETDLGVDGTVYQPISQEDLPVQINQCVADGNVLCITVGYLLTDATLAAAQANPAVNFAIVDVSYGAYPANLRGMVFAVDEVAYLAGTLAGLMTDSGKIGVIGGMDIPIVNTFILPYKYGAQWANHPVLVPVEYANDFGNPVVGATLAQTLMTQGADVIYGVGGAMGNGAILAAAQAGAWVVGVDTDVYDTVFGGGSVAGADRVLTSVLKRVDNAVYNTILDQVNTTFTPGDMTNNVANGGVGLAPYHDATASIPQDVQNAVTATAQGIANGTINVWEPYWKAFVYLPVILR